ncbi:MAG TPA: DUF5818 domain-containing protein [Thermoanaerobaculia bacterium]|jgi:hypothetical protein
MTSTIRTLARGSRFALLLGAALSLPACVVDTAPYPHGPYDRGYGGNGPVDQIDGFVTFEGRCPTIRDHDSDEVFFLTGDTRGLRPGDHVLLRERAADGNPCGAQGPTVAVLGIDAIWRGEDHDSPYFDSRRDGDFRAFIAENRDRGGWYSDRYGYLNGSGGDAGRPGGYDRDGDRGDRDRDRGYDNGYPPNPQSPPIAPPPPNGQYDDRQPPAPPGDVEQEDRDDEHEQLRVDGRLDFGGTCPAIHTPDGTSYDLAGDLESYHGGDQVRVIGVLAGRSSCGGTTLKVDRIQGGGR